MNTVPQTQNLRTTPVEVTPELDKWMEEAFGAYAVASAPLKDGDSRLSKLTPDQQADVLRFDAPDVRGEHYWSTYVAPALISPPIAKPVWATSIEFNQEPQDDGFVQVRWVHEGEYANLTVVIDQYVDIDLTYKIVSQHPLGIVVYVEDVSGRRTSVEIDAVALPLLIGGLGDVQNAIKGVEQ